METYREGTEIVFIRVPCVFITYEMGKEGEEGVTRKECVLYVQSKCLSRKMTYCLRDKRNFIT